MRGNLLKPSLLRGVKCTVDFNIMKNIPLVSVCIPAFNAARYIEETIISIINQDYKKLEIIVSDNCSTDNTREVVLTLADEFKNISIINNVINVGVANNWNKVIQAAQGEFVLLVSADDLLEESFVTRAVDIFNNYPEVDIVSFYSLILKDGCLSPRKTVFGLKVKPLPRGIYRNYLNLLLRKNPFSINFSLFSRNALYKLSSNKGMFVKNFLNCDYDLWFRTVENSLVIYYDCEPLGRYRLHSSNLSRNKGKLLRQSFLILSSRKSYLRKNCFFSFKYCLGRLIVNYIYCVYFTRSISRDKRLFKVLVGNLLFKL